MTPVTLDTAGDAGAPARARGFVVSASDYAEFRDAGDLRRRLGDALHGTCVDDPGRLMAAALHARSMIRWEPWPEALRTRLEQAYAALVAETGEAAVVVGCVETDDGLPGVSGGEPYVVHDAHGLLRAVRRCWCSLYEPHRVFERCARGLPQVDVAVALRVQPRSQSVVPTAPSHRLGELR